MVPFTDSADAVAEKTPTDKQNKLSLGAMQSSMYGIIAETAIGCCGSVDRHRIAG
jgi:hypothetical protein